MIDRAVAPDVVLQFVSKLRLKAGNVAEAIRRAQPWAVDVSSGVEAAKGIKDAGKIAALMRGVRTSERL